ncbi:LacI family transcriptional regulator [Anaerobacillus alkalidiazotrophicus]|uniref:LacI family transcriptional regulator n=1 Tax=Anaerobacillus alkalidiazotrophicus TaxID=472963 RepID=A0A1S2M0R6_9BACI|nr:LacI family DNA-binding transcriptional regulator [Anaerobacillus alkalidiazotrophicus]OIJ18110.1 LacI family transcriptional regulator [Anaerobacillus alkalidiazotrophicus]OIJ19589.1 LacI family transcriptional regulator [Anaerobacillus alkalidiazotrophicus]
MANIKDVAERAGVSVTTVSRVLNNRGYIGKETRKKVEEAMAEMNYSPNQIARALQKSQSYILGMIVPDSNHPFFSELIKYVEMYANEKNYKILICNSLDQPKKEARYLNMLSENRVDGIIMCSHTLDVDAYKQVSFPIVTFDRIISNQFPYVACDNFRGGELATEHLIELGCKNLLHISGPLKLDLLANRRADAFKLSCMKHNVHYEVIEGSNDNLTFEYFTDLIIDKISEDLSKFDGVFCSNDIVAYALYLYATENGIKVPEQLKIVGYDYHSFTRMLQTPKLTTISQPTNRLGKVLSSTIMNMIENKDEETINNTVIDVELIKGHTT